MNLVLLYIFLIVVIVLYVWKQHTSSTLIDSGNHSTCTISFEKPGWRTGKTKCFSCLKQAYQLSGGNECAVFNEHPIKYYELPPIPGMGYPKMGYM